MPVDIEWIPLKRLAVFFVHDQKEERQHRDDHEQSRAAWSEWSAQNKKQRDADQRTAAKTDDLSFSEVEE